jgi:protein TonB
VVVTGYGTEKKIDNTGAATIRLNNAAPEGGWEAFADYIAANKSASLTNNPPLQVELTFTVSRNGKLSDFNIAKSVSPAHHAEAIRLIKNGPKWKVTKGRKAVVKLIVSL